GRSRVLDAQQVHGSACDEALPQLAEPRDAGHERLARLQEALWGAAHADAGRGPGEDQVARAQRDDAGERLDQDRDGDDALARPAVLDALAVDLGPELEVVAVGHLVRRDEPGADRREAGVRLAEPELGRRTLHLRDALGEVLPDRQTGDVRPAGAGRGVPRL